MAWKASQKAFLMVGKDHKWIDEEGTDILERAYMEFGMREMRT